MVLTRSDCFDRYYLSKDHEHVCRVCSARAQCELDVTLSRSPYEFLFLEALFKGAIYIAVQLDRLRDKFCKRKAGLLYRTPSAMHTFWVKYKITPRVINRSRNGYIDRLSQPPKRIKIGGD